MRGATLIYNGVKIALVRTREIAAEPQWSDDGVDYLWTKYTISIDGIVNAEETAYEPGDPPLESPGTLPAITYNSIRHYLSQPRAELIVLNWTFTLFDTGNLNDVNNGPIPGALVVRRIDGARTFHVSFTITTFLIECPQGTAPQPLISNRWGQTAAIGRERLTTLTTNGVAMFRIDILRQMGVVADLFRDLILPPIPPGFHRVNVSVGVNTKGNSLKYDVQDVEVMTDLGDTGATGSGTHVTHVEGFFNVSSMGSGEKDGLPGPFSIWTVQIKIWGTKQASNWVLTQLAFQTLFRKLPLGQANVRPDTFATVQQFTITQDLFNRYVEVMVAMRVSLKDMDQAVAYPFGQVDPGREGVYGLKNDEILPGFNGVNPGLPKGNGSRGTWDGTISSTSELIEACQAPPRPLPAYGTGGQAPPDYEGPPPAVRVYPTNITEPYPTRYRKQSMDNPYTESRISTQFDSHEGRYQAPISKGPKTSQSNQENQRTCSVVSLHQPISRLRVKWVAERFGVPPECPAWKMNTDQAVLLSKKVYPAEITLMPDGVTPSFQVSGEYVYAMKKPMDTFNSIPFAVPQWINGPYGAPELTLVLPGEGQDFSEHFKHGIIDQDPGSYA